MRKELTPQSVAGKYRLIATVTADFLQDLRELLSTSLDCDSDREETRVEMTVSSARIRHFIALAEALKEKLPCTQEALASGGIDLAKAQMLHTLTKPLDAELAGLVEEKVLPTAHELSNSEMRALGERYIQELDPHGAEERHQRRKKDRSFTVTSKPDGMGELRLYSTAPEVQAAYQAIDQQVRNTRTTDDGRTQDQARADLAAAVLAAGGAGSEGFAPVDPKIVITIPKDVIEGKQEHGAEMQGHGAILGSMARQMAVVSSVWLRMITDPATGVGIDFSRRGYRLSQAERDFLITRHKTCRFPNCQAPAVTSDLDHREQYQHSRVTRGWDMAPLCRRHHILKDQHGWAYEILPNGDLAWTSPSGAKFLVRMDPGADPDG
ncbi:HNH endonuclease [Pseudonocardiaceae bacterium YIM PH 21723]|nr:HNH endonuclease [Pseudonocardiaceae bacterium YIM PH 21723]